MKGVMIANEGTEIVINNDIIVPIHEGALYSDDPKVIGSDRVLVAVIVDNGEELLAHNDELKELFANPYDAPESLVMMNPINFLDRNCKPLSFGSKSASRRFVSKEAKSWFKDRLHIDCSQLKSEDDIAVFVVQLFVNEIYSIATPTARYFGQVTVTDESLGDDGFERKAATWLQDIRRGK